MSCWTRGYCPRPVARSQEILVHGKLISTRQILAGFQFQNAHFLTVAGHDRITGTCIPLDSNGQNQDCYNTYGFLASNTQYEGYESVHFLKAHLGSCVTVPSTVEGEGYCIPYDTNNPLSFGNACQTRIQCVMCLSVWPLSQCIAEQLQDTNIGCLSEECWAIPKCK